MLGCRCFESDVVSTLIILASASLAVDVCVEVDSGFASVAGRFVLAVGLSTRRSFDSDWSVASKSLGNSFFLSDFVLFNGDVTGTTSMFPGASDLSGFVELLTPPGGVFLCLSLLAS